MKLHALTRLSGFLLTLCLTVCLSAAWLSRANAEQQPVRLELQPVNGAVYVLTGSGGNIGLLSGKDGWLMIDSQFAATSELIRTTLDRVSKAPVRFLINSHWHQDHTGGNLFFAHAGANLVSSHNTRRRLSSEQMIKAFHKTFAALPDEARPTITTDGELLFHLNGEEVFIKVFPSAHTDGDLIVWFKQANVVHLGDIYFQGQFPFIDRSSGGSINGMIDAVEWALNHLPADVRIIPGHGQLSDTAGLNDYYHMLKTARQQVKFYTDQHQSLAAIKSQKPLASLAQKWGKGFIKQDALVEALFDEFAR